MNVITCLNEKGGVGKTTVALHVAAGLAIRGASVLLIDADAQANATQELNLPEAGGLYRLLVQDGKWRDLLAKPEPERWHSGNAAGQLGVLTSNIETRAIPLVVDDVLLLRDRLEEVSSIFDVVVIDTSPTPSMLHTMIYVATDYMLYPTKCESLALEGLTKSIDHMEKLNNARKVNGLGETKLLGVQPTMYDVRTNAHDYGLSLVTGKFKRKAFPALPVRTIWRDRSFARKTLYAYDPDHVATTEAFALVDRVEKGLSA